MLRFSVLFLIFLIFRIFFSLFFKKYIFFSIIINKPISLCVWSSTFPFFFVVVVCLFVAIFEVLLNYFRVWPSLIFQMDFYRIYFCFHFRSIKRTYLNKMWIFSFIVCLFPFFALKNRKKRVKMIRICVCVCLLSN